MRIKLISDLNTIDQHRDQWNRLADHAVQAGIAGVDGKRPPKPFPFYRWEWMGNWYRSLASDHTPLLIVGLDESDNWIGIAPFFIDQSTPLLCRLRFWGSGQACTDYLGLISEPQSFQQFALEVSDCLTREIRPGGALASIDRVELEGVSESMHSTRWFGDAMEVNGFTKCQTMVESCWVLELRDSWQELRSQFSKSLRRKVKKAEKRLADPQTNIRSTDTESLIELWPHFVELHQQRRKSLGQDGCFSNSDFDSFLYLATESLIQSGQAELTMIEYESRPLAAMLLFNNGQTNFMYQSGMDPSRLNLEPGYQLICHALMKSIADELQHFDFLRGDEPYKARWLTTPISLKKTDWIPRKLTAQVKQGFLQTMRDLRTYLRGSESAG